MPFAHIRGDVGDGDPRAVAAVLGALDPDRVVVIAGILRVDGGQRNVCQVDATLEHGLRHRLAVALGLGRRALGVDLVDLLANEHLGDLDRQLAGRPEDCVELAPPASRLIIVG